MDGDHTARRTDDRDRVRAASDIVQVIGESVSLKRDGSEYLGLCPFHDDHKPSLTVVPAKQIYKCFVCGAAGDVFEWVQQRQGVDFRAALERLAARAGIELSARKAERPPAPARDDAEIEQKKREARQVACEIWRRAARGGRQHPRLVEYLKHRGIDVAALPGGVVPPELAFLENCPDPDNKSNPTWPAMVCRLVEFAQEEGRLKMVTSGVLRVFMDKGGPGKRPPEMGKAKRMKGACGGRALCLSKDLSTGVLVVTEGTETGLTCLQATGAAVWPALSANTMPAFAERLPVPLFTPRPGGAWIHTVVWGADLNPRPVYPEGEKRTRAIGTLREDAHCTEAEAAEIVAMSTGEHWAHRARLALRARMPWVRQHVRAPSAAVCPQLVEAANGRERPKSGKGVDWNDVGNAAGMDAVREGLLGGIDLVASAAEAEGLHATLATSTPESTVSSGPGGGGEAPSSAGGGRGGIDDPATRGLMWEEEDDDGRKYVCISPGAHDRARLFLLQECVIKGARRFRLVRWGGKFFWYQGGQWFEIQDDRVVLFGMVTHWLAGFHTVRTLKRGKEIKRVYPTVKMVEEIVRNLAAEAYVNADSMPAWLPPSFDDDGGPLWGTAVRRFVKYESPENGDAGDWLVYANGRISTRRLIEGDVVMHPATPDLFTFATRPYPLDIPMLKRVLAEGFTDAIAKKVCPHFWWWLHDATDDVDGPSRRDCLQRMFGDSSSGWRKIEKIFMLPGPQRAGKDLIQEAIAASHGEMVIAASSFEGLQDRFGLAPIVGKSVMLLPDAKASSFGDSGVVVERLKTMSGNGRQSVRDLYTKADCNVKLRPRIWIFLNDEPEGLMDNSGALSGRLVVWPLTKSYLGRENLELKPAVATEGPGINLWALRGLVDLWNMERPRIDAPALGREIQEEIERNVSIMTGFLKDCCDVAPDHSVEFNTCFTTYQRWCEAYDRKGVGRSRFSPRLRPLVPGFRVTQPTHDRDGDYVPRRIVGLTLKEPNQMPPEVTLERPSGDGSTPFGTVPRKANEPLPPF